MTIILERLSIVKKNPTSYYIFYLDMVKEDNYLKFLKN
jgi:hypothetical protein